VNLNVAAGGSVAITCAQDWGFLEVDQDTPYTSTYGHVSVIPGQTFAPEYINDSGAGQTDDFYLTDGEFGSGIGDPAHQIHIIVTIGAATSPLTISPATLTNPAVAAPYSQQLSTSGGTAPYTYSIAGGGLPPGLSLSSSGLISGTPTGADTYSFTVHVQDSAGTPVTLDKNYSVVIPAPNLDLSPDSPPSGAINLPYSQQFTVSGGTAPYNYSVEAGLGILPPGLTLSSSGLLSGTPTATGSYTFSLKYGDSTTFSGGGQAFKAQNVTVVIATATVPGAPTIGTATAGNAQATVSFTAPASNGGAAITGYTVTSSPGGFTASGSASPITVTGLTNGTAYTFTVTATNAVGTGAASAASNSVTPKGTQTITFANPGTQNFGTAPTLSATASSGLTPAFSSTTTGVCTVTSGGALTFVTAGTCTIDADQAGNAVFQAAPTVSQSFTVAAIVPGAPTIGTATAGDAQAAVSFTAPASTGGAAITGYTVTSSPGGFTGSGSASPITVTGLTNGTAYTFTVTASNSAGTGLASAASNSVTPKGNQTISGFIANPSSPVFSPNGTFSVTATASSSLPVTFGIDAGSASVCSIAGSTVTMLSAGTCSVTADQAGNVSYLPAPQQTLAVIITAPPVPVANAVSATVAYGSSANPITLSLTGGAADSVAVATAPAHGTASASGTSITYTPTAGFAGSDSFTYTATNTSGTSTAATVSITVGDATLALTPASGTLSLAYATTYSQAFTTSGGAAPYSYALTGTLPAGISFNNATGTLSGTPTEPGSFPVSVTATDSSTGAAAPFSITQNYTLQVAAPTVTLAPASLPVDSVGTAYPATGISASGGAAPYGYAITAGALPPGLTLSPTGQLSGTPTSAGSFSFTVTATDAHGQTGSFAYTLNIGAPTIVVAPATLPDATA